MANDDKQHGTHRWPPASIQDVVKHRKECDWKRPADQGQDKKGSK